MAADRCLDCNCPDRNCVGNITANGMQARRTRNRATDLPGGEEGVQRRDYCRTRLRDFLQPGTTEFVFRLSTQPYSDTCCMLAWRLEEGFTEGFVYEHRAEVLKGIYADDPGLGGARLKGVTTAGGEMDPGVHEVDPVAFHVCCAWWRLQCEIEDTQPNAETVEGMIQLDTITERELYQEYYVAVTDADVAERHVLQFGPWKSLWQEHFSKVSIVVAKNLLSKDRVRPKLREFARTQMGSSPAQRAKVGHLRRVYRETIRNERMFYYDGRFRAQLSPLLVLTTIQDGATQDHYRTPHLSGLDLGQSSVGVKLVGQIVHGVCTCIFLVPDHVIDDANLASTLMLRSLEIAMQERQKMHLPAYAPPKSRMQLDGAPGNWSAVNFAFADHLVREGILENAIVVRNPVGNTHEDIDGLFGVLRRFLKPRNWRTMDELKALIRQCLQLHKCLHVENVVDSLDFGAFFRQGGADEQALDPELGGFSYTGARGDDAAGTFAHGTAGYHVVNVNAGAELGSSIVTFKRYQQDIFHTIAFEASELPPEQRTPDREYPCVLAVANAPEPATILLRRPAGQPALAARKADWKDDLTGAVRRIKRYLHDFPEAVAWWELHLARAEDRADPAALARALLPHSAGGMERVPRHGRQLTAAEAVMAGAAVRTPASTIASSLASANVVRAAVAVQDFHAAAPLADGTLVVVRVNGAAPIGDGPVLLRAVTVDGWRAGAGGYPACVAEVMGSRVASAGGGLGNGVQWVTLKWWRLETNPGAGSDVEWAAGKWVPWIKARGSQYESEELQAAVAFAPLSAWPSSIRTGAVKNRWLKLEAPAHRAVHSLLGNAVS